MCCKQLLVRNVYPLYLTDKRGQMNNAFLELLNVSADSLGRDGGVENERDDETVQTLTLVVLGANERLQIHTMTSLNR